MVSDKVQDEYLMRSEPLCTSVEESVGESFLIDERFRIVREGKVMSLVMLLVNVILALLSSWAGARDANVLAFLGYFVTNISCAATLLLLYKKDAMEHDFIATILKSKEEQADTVPNRMHFLALIAQNNPGIPIHEWNVIATKMNDYLFDSGSYPDRHYFKDGEACFEKFKTVFLDSYSKEEIGTPSERYDVLQPYISKAVDLYEANIRLFWKQQDVGGSSAQ